MGWRVDTAQGATGRQALQLEQLMSPIEANSARLPVHRALR